MFQRLSSDIFLKEKIDLEKDKIEQVEKQLPLEGFDDMIVLITDIGVL